MEIKVEWKENQIFIGYDSKGKTVKIGKEGFSPMEMVLIALAGCTAMDVAEILLKMRKNLKELRVSVEGERNEEYPRYWKKAKIKYEIKGENIKKEDVERAIKLSMDVYCSVSATISGKTEISYTYEIKNT